ncbi:MAG: hypothetical protein HGA61_04745, partial [Candidatus Moranbacteria bacterium]|nr:hypothetical protein [Candidatus Moranbacteria bacterium]
ARVGSVRELVIRLIYRAIYHFMEHLRIINQIADDVEQKINRAMENRFLINLFSLQKSLVYYLNFINSNGVVLDKLKLNDASFVFEPESNPALGKGFRCGFLGLLHLEIIKERLEREFNFTPTITTPGVVYELKLKGSDQKKTIYSAMDMPDPSTLEDIAEPYVKLEIITPAQYLGGIMELMSNLRSTYLNTEYLDLERILISFEVPLTDIIVNFHDDLKSVTSGYASMNYEIVGYQSSDLVKMDILLAGEKVEALSRIVPRQNANSEGKKIVEKLAGAVPRQNFAIAVQAAIGGKIVARETIKPFRKDVIAKLYGGDVTRKNKLLDKQKKGKKKMKNVGNVQIPSEAYLAVLKR